jgi:MAX-like protein X
MQNWKYWVFSRLMQPLLETYDRTVSSSSPEDLGRTAGSWLDQHASLVQLRPLVLRSLKELSVTTEVLSEPHRMPQVSFGLLLL